MKGHISMKTPASVSSRLVALAFVSGLGVWLASSSTLAQAPTAPAPTYAVGDGWEMTFGPFKVVAIEEGLTVREFPANKDCPNCRYFSDSQNVLVKVLKADGSEAKHPQIGFPSLSFPLSVGKEWTYDATFFNEAANVSIPLRHTFRVLGYETVETKAGPLKAFKISHARTRENLKFSGGRPDWGTAVYWYSPEAKAIVKRQVVSTGAARSFGNDYELVSFSLK
jgi:hypothetical protein